MFGYSLYFIMYPLLFVWIFFSRTYSYSEPQLYSQNSSGSYFDTQGAVPQVSTVVTTHSLANNGSTNGGLTMGLTGGQIISSSGAYLIGSNAMDGSAPHTAAQTTRASPATVQQNPVIKSLLPAFSHCKGGWTLNPDVLFELKTNLVKTDMLYYVIYTDLFKYHHLKGDIS